MSLTAGTRLGPYEIGSALGVGGMGEVYRARDTKLEREVAIKVLPEEFARDQERLARFEREAKLLASLNHPNIATIHGFEEADGIKALVLELVEGPTLAERIAEGAIPLEETIPMARQIAEALEAGHETGVIHRDLKPANVKLREDGTVKVLDYGLAKAFEGEPTDDDAELSQSPTLTRHGTQVGVILGTAAYMSPEQAKGKRVDKRTDIFAFGAVLFEMLTGKKAFPGDDVSEILAAVIRAEPDWSLLPAIPANVDGLLRRCLDKDATRRLRDIGEARLTLEGTADLDAVEIPERRRSPLTWAAGALVFGILVGALATRWPTPGESSNAAPVVRFDIPVPGTGGGHLASVFAMTPDGSQLVFVRTVGGVQQLFRRAMGEQEIIAIRGTEGGTEPFLSPDGEWVGFHADGKLKKVRWQGGPSAVLCDAPRLLGASWGDNDKIVFAREGRLWEVSGAGGAPRPLTGAQEGDLIPTFPEVLPGSKAVLFSQGIGSHTRVAVLSLETGEERVLVDGADPRFASPRYLLFVRDASIWAVPFDVDSLELVGEAVPVLEGVHRHGGQGSQFTISRNGSLAHSRGRANELRKGNLAFVDRSGHETLLPHESADYLHPRLSPDGGRLAVSIRSAQGFEVWILDLDRPTRTRLTFSDLDDLRSVWTPDGRRIAFGSQASGAGDLYWKFSDGTGNAELLLESVSLKWPFDFSHDGTTLLYSDVASSTNRDIWTMTLDEEPTPFVATTFDEVNPRFSPDGRWVAYVSNESGRYEIYARPYPGPGGAVVLSTDGGTEPVWSQTGGELFFRSGNKMMVIPIRQKPAFDFGDPELLFEGSFRRADNGWSYDVTSDGQRFVMVPLASDVDTAQIHVVLNWIQELDQMLGQ